MVKESDFGGGILFFLLPAGIFIFYLAPALFLSLWGGGEGESGLLLMSAAVITSYFLLWAFKVDLLIFFPLVAFLRRLGVGVVSRGAMYVIAISYLVLMAYVMLTAPTIPAFDAFRGCGIDWLAQGRETFLRARSGWEASLNYMYSMYRSFLAPLVVCYLYATGDRFRHAFLIAFAATLMLTLEKSVAVFIFAPLACLFVGSKRYHCAIFVVFLMLLSIAGTSFLARGGLGRADAAGCSVGVKGAADAAGFSVGVKGAADLDQSMSSVPARYNKFNFGGQVGYIANRIIYIPYITAIDWIRYHREVLHGDYLHGRGISLVALIFGENRIRIDREVFRFQWGQNSTGTGAANTVFFVDAYVNFGWIGCFLYNLAVVFIVRIVTLSDVVGIQAAMVVPMFYLVFNSLTAMMFSGAIFFAILLAIFSKGHERGMGIGDA